MNENNPPNRPPQNEEMEVFAPEQVTNALESISRAEVDMSIATARKFPRQLSTVKRDMLSFATLDEETAASCFYSLPRGGKTIQGPSVRLAEIAVSSYGNLRAGSRILQTVVDGPNPHVVVQAVATDLEKNVTVSIEKRRRITKKKNKDCIDEDDINLAANAGSAIAFRDAVFKVVPLALIKPVFEQAKKVAIGDAKTLASRRVSCIEAFAKMGITQDRVLTKLERKSIEDVGLEDLETLIGLFNAIKDGEAQIDEAFPSVPKPVNLGNAPAPKAPPTPPSAPAKAPEPRQRTPEPPKPAPAPAKPTPAPAPKPPEPILEVLPEPETEQETITEASPEPEPEPGPTDPEEGPTEPETEPEPKLEPAPQNEHHKLTELRALIEKSGVTEAQVVGFCQKSKILKADKGENALSFLVKEGPPPSKTPIVSQVNNLIVAWNNILPKIKAL